jgi:hypothetical protein
MGNRRKLGLLSVVLAGSMAMVHGSPLDCACVANLSALQKNACKGVVTVLCTLASKRFSTNVLPGSCNEVPASGVVMNAGTNVIVRNVMELQSNQFQCIVRFVATPQVPVASPTVACPTNTTVDCGSGWNFDLPVPITACSGVTVTEFATANSGTGLATGSPYYRTMEV